MPLCLMNLGRRPVKLGDHFLSSREDFVEIRRLGIPFSGPKNLPLEALLGIVPLLQEPCAICIKTRILPIEIRSLLMDDGQDLDSVCDQVVFSEIVRKLAGNWQKTNGFAIEKAQEGLPQTPFQVSNEESTEFCAAITEEPSQLMFLNVDLLSAQSVIDGCVPVIARLIGFRRSNPQDPFLKRALTAAQYEFATVQRISKQEDTAVRDYFIGKWLQQARDNLCQAQQDLAENP